MIELIIFILILSLINVFYEWTFPSKEIWGYRVFHTFSFLRNVLIVAGITYFNFFPITENPANIWAIVWIAITFYWIAFDMLWNWLHGQKWYYVGTGFLDLIFGNWILFIKIFFLFVSSFILLQYYG